MKTGFTKMKTLVGRVKRANFFHGYNKLELEVKSTQVVIKKDGKKEVKFFALAQFFDLKNYEDRLVIHEAEFHEIKDNLEVTRLIEIQQVFTKLLRRI